MILYAQSAFGLTADDVKSVRKHFNSLLLKAAYQ